MKPHNFAQDSPLSLPPFLTGRALAPSGGRHHGALPGVANCHLSFPPSPFPHLWPLERIQADFILLHLNSFLLESALKEVLNSPPNPDEKWRGGGGRLAQLLTKRPPLRRNVRFEQISWRFGCAARCEFIRISWLARLLGVIFLGGGKNRLVGSNIISQYLVNHAGFLHPTLNSARTNACDLDPFHCNKSRNLGTPFFCD